jgi:erythromycin esterase
MKLNVLRTLDPAAPLDDLAWLDDVIGTARVVAIGESAHYNREFLQLRHRVLRYLVERHGFGAYAMESGFVEGRLVADWLRGEAPDTDHVVANGVTSLMGLWTETRTTLEWLRQGSTRFYGIDLSGSNVSLLPGLDAVTAYLAAADPSFEVDPALRATAAEFSAPSAFGMPAAFAAYGALPQERRDALTAGLADLVTRLVSRRFDYDDSEFALRAAQLTAAVDAVFREMARGDQRGVMLIREAAIADTVSWILDREDRVVLAAHNAHVQRVPAAMPGMPPTTTLGVHLADRLGEDYVVIGTTSGTGETLNSGTDFFTGTLFMPQGPPEPDSLDGLMAAAGDTPFGIDLHHPDSAPVRAATRQRYGFFYAELDPSTAYDALVHLPEVTPATLDQAAVAAAPEEVRKVLSTASDGDLTAHS